MARVSETTRTEIEILSEEFLAGKITDEAYWKRWEEIKEEARRQQVREGLDAILSGKKPEKEEVLPADPELDRKFDEHLRRKYAIA